MWHHILFYYYYLLLVFVGCYLIVPIFFLWNVLLHHGTPAVLTYLYFQLGFQSFLLVSISTWILIHFTYILVAICSLDIKAQSTAWGLFLCLFGIESLANDRSRKYIFYSGLVLTSLCEGVAIATYSYMKFNDPGLSLVTPADIGLLLSAVHIWALALRLGQAIRAGDKVSLLNEGLEKKYNYNNSQITYQATNNTYSSTASDKPENYYYCPASLAVCCPILDPEETDIESDTLDTQGNTDRTSTSDGISVGAW